MSVIIDGVAAVAVARPAAKHRHQVKQVDAQLLQVLDASRHTSQVTAEEMGIRGVADPLRTEVPVDVTLTLPIQRDQGSLTGPSGCRGARHDHCLDRLRLPRVQSGQGRTKVVAPVLDPSPDLRLGHPGITPSSHAGHPMSRCRSAPAASRCPGTVARSPRGRQPTAGPRP